jgi:hypothetical protein
MAGKSGPKDVNPSSRGSSPSRNVAGGPGHSFAQQPIPGPTSPGQPIAMKKALAKKGTRGGPATGFPGLVR